MILSFLSLEKLDIELYFGLKSLNFEFQHITTIKMSRYQLQTCSLALQVNLNNQRLDLVGGSHGGINVSPCWSHPCSVQNSTNSSPCGRMGTCRPIMNDYSCECPLGLTGLKCESVLSYLPALVTVATADGSATSSQQQPTRSTRLDNAPAFTGDSFLHFDDEPIAQK